MDRRFGLKSRLTGQVLVGLTGNISTTHHTTPTNRRNTMGYHTTAYAFYGVNVPKAQWTESHVAAEADRILDVLAENQELLPDINFLMAGNYDDDMLFLTADVTPDEYVEVQLGTFRRYEAAGSHRLMKLTDQLNEAAQLLGYDVLELDPPAYIVVPDFS